MTLDLRAAANGNAKSKHNIGTDLNVGFQNRVVRKEHGLRRDHADAVRERRRTQALLHLQFCIRQFGARFVSIMPDTAQFTGGYSETNRLPFPILTDMDLGYLLALGLVFWVGDEVKGLYDEAGIDLQKYQGNQGYFLPIVAKFIVGQDGLVKARQVNIEFRERMEPDAIVAALKNLTTT